jgi:aldose sugar dehydrogenase
MRVVQVVAKRSSFAVLFVSLIAALPAARLAAQTVSDPSLTVSPVVAPSSLSQPTSMAFLAPDDILVLEKANGQVRRIVSGVLQAAPVLDVAVNSSSERGLLGIAINTESPPRVFLYYTEVADPDGDGLPDSGTPLGNRVYAYDWNPGTGELENPDLILDLPVTSGPNHDGGVIFLGPVPPPGPGQIGDGSSLYVIIGDLNRSGQLQNIAGGAAPDDTSVILRVLQDGSPDPANPFVPYCSTTTSQTCPTGSGCPGAETCITEVASYYAYGIRNSFGMSRDPLTGDIWDTENGPGDYDEINRVVPGFNSGWNRIMGPDSRDPQGLGDLFNMPNEGSTYSDPEFSWLATVAPTTILFPVGTSWGASYDDVALIGDVNTGQIWSLPLNATRDGFDLAGFTGLGDLVADSVAERNQLVFGSGFAGVTDLEIGPDGDVYAVSIGMGTIYRISGGVDTPTPTDTVPPASTPTATATATVPPCAPTPESCRLPVVPGKSKIMLKDNATDDGKDLLVWKWIKGAATDKSEFGDPLGATTYELCLYDAGGVVGSATIAAGSEWKETGSGYKFKDTALDPDGVQKVLLKAGEDEKAKIIVKAKGDNLAMPNLSLLASPLTVQLKRSGSSVCWGAVYSFPPAIKNDASQFKDAAD